MLGKFLKYKGELSLATLIIGAIIVLGWFIDVHNSPFYEKVMIEFKHINETLVKLNFEINNVKEEATKTNNYVRGQLSREVQANAENKVGYPEFWHTDDVIIEAFGIKQNIKK